MRVTFVAGLAALSLLAACSANSGSAATAENSGVLSQAALDSVNAVDAAFAAAVNAKDTAAVLAVYAPDAKVMPQDSPILDGAAGRAMIGGLAAGGASDIVMTSITTYGVGDLAYHVGTASFKMGGASENVKYTEVLRRGADGKWRYVVDMFSNTAPPAAPPAAGKKK